MERNREARRGTVAAVTGGLSRRRQRSSSLRDSPEEDGGMEMAETMRLRDRGSKKDRDRDRSSRSKRRRGERMLHGSNKDEVDDSSDESIDEEEEEEEEDDVSVAARLPPPPPPPPNPASSSSSPSQSNHHQHQQNRKSLPIKVTRSPPVWKADETIGFSVPRKARSASTKRSYECWVSGGSGSGEQIPRQASTSPSRFSPASTTQISPSSSNASARKKMKQMSGSKHRPPKVSKSPSSIQEDIEIEVAEVLYGMTKQFQCPPKEETSKIDSKDTNGGSGNEAKSRISSPNLISPAPPSSSVLPPSNFISNPTSLPAAAPKRKKPRLVKLEEERPSSPGGLLAPEASKMEPEHQMKDETSSPRSEKNTACPVTGNDGGSTEISVPPVAAVPLDVQQDSAKKGNNPVPDSRPLKGEPDGQNQMRNQEEPSPPEKETPFTDLDVNRSEETTAKAALASDSPREEKFSIDLMAPPPGKLSPERDNLCEFDAGHKSLGPGIEMALKVDIGNKEEKAVENTAEVDEMFTEDKKVDKSMPVEFHLKKQMVKEMTVDLHIDLEKPEKDSLCNSKLQLQKQQQKSPKLEPKQEKAAPSASPPAMPTTIAGWPGSLPPFGYMGQVPSLQAVGPMDGTTGASNSLQPPSFLSPQPRPKRCVTHCYIAQNIYYHQRISRMNPFWPASAGAGPIYGAKPYNLNSLPSSDGKNKASFQANKAVAAVAAVKGPTPSKEGMPAANNPPAEAAEKKQLVLQQIPQSGSATNILHSPAFIFPLNQQQAAAAAATRSGALKSTPGSGNGVSSSSASSSAMVSTGAGGGSAATMNLSFTGLPPTEAQYLAILQNNAYPFAIPAHVAGPPPFRGPSPAQAMPFFNGPFYSSQMLHPSQLQQQQLLGPQQAPHTQQQGHQHTSTSSGSSSSQKHPQPPQALGSGASGAGGSNHGFPAANQQQHLLPHQARRQEGDKPLEDSPSTIDGRNSQAQKNVYAHNFAVPIHPQNFTLMSAAATAATLGGREGHGDKLHMQQQPQQNQSMKLDLGSSQAFAMPFISFNGVAAAPPGLDFSSMAQNHAIFPAHGFNQIAAAAAAAAVAQAAQQKKTYPEDGRSSGGDSISANTVGEEEKKMIAGSKAPGSSLQHSFGFSKSDVGPPFSSMLGSTVINGSSRTLGLIPAPANRTSGSASTTTSAAEAPVVHIPNSQQQQQQFLQLQKQQQQQQQQQFLQLQKQQQQQQLQMQHQVASMKSSGSSSNASVCSDRLPAGSTVTKFPQALAGFPQALVQGGSSSQSPQWKTSITRAATPAPPQSSAQPVLKNNPPPQQQGRAPQQSLPAQSHQTQISFCVNSVEAVPAGGTSIPSSSCTSAIAIGTTPNSVSKSANGNPRASACVKLGSSAAALSLPQQSSAKSCVPSPGQKSSPVNNNRNAPPSMLGHPHIAPAPNSISKPQQQHSQQLQKQQQQFPQPQFFFSNSYMHAQPPQSNVGATAAAGYYQRRPSELTPSQQAPQQQLNSTPGSSGMLALGPSALTTDPAKAAATAAAAANGMKGMPPPGLLQAAHLAVAAQSASGTHHPLVPASFPFLSMPAVCLKPAADQKPVSGNDNSHACWQPEKR